MSIISLSTKMPYSYYKEKLQEIHDKIKEHQFRIEFKNEFSKGTFKSLFKEYRGLIYDATEVLGYMEYYCDDSPIARGDGFWIHDFRGAMLTLGFFFDERFKDDYYDTPVERINLTPRQIYNKTGVDDINIIMLWFEKFITDIHVFLQTDIFDRITGVEYEPVTKPHNGWYYKHLVEYERKEDGSWGLIHEPNWIGTKDESKKS